MVSLRYNISPGKTVEILGFLRNDRLDAVAVHHILGDPEHRQKKSVVKYTSKGEAYFLTEHARIYLADCVKYTQ